MLSRAHERRLRAIYRSAGWPCLDTIEIELLDGGLLQRVQPAQGGEYLRVTETGISALARTLRRNRGAYDRHEALVKRVAEQQLRAGRMAWCGLSLFGRHEEQWLQLRPDVYSIRNTSAEDQIHAVIHEIKVERSDLKSDLKKPGKRAGYIALCSECYYVLAEGIARPEEIPPECGVIVARAGLLELARPAPRRAHQPAFYDWMALARADRFRSELDTEPLL